jgi:hypothetical protein
MVVNRDAELLLGLLLADDVFVEKGLHFLRLGQMVGSRRGVGLTAVVFKNRVADGDTLVADVRPGIIAGGGDELGNSVL